MSVVSVFYISLLGIITLLLYKTLIGRKYCCNVQKDKEHSSDVYYVVLERVCIVTATVAKHTVIPVCVYIKHNIKLTHRGCIRFVKDMRSVREKPGTMVNNNGVASAYVKKILEQKKIIRKRQNKVFHSENL